MFVVYVFDDGYHVYDAGQVRRYHKVVSVEACYSEGRQIPQAIWQHLAPEAA